LAILTRGSLQLMLDQATGTLKISYPKEVFLDVVVLAHKAAMNNPSPPFTLRQLESMIFDNAELSVVEVEENEIRSLLKLAMEAASPEGK
jgi:hypothetical protein